MARSIEEQTGWKRPLPVSVVMNADLLEKVTEFDYDLNDPGFVQYFTARYGQTLRCKLGWDAVVTWLANYSVPAPTKSWELTRAALQDCWEIWVNHGHRSHDEV